MSPSATSIQPPALPWDHETFWPAKPTTPTAAGTATTVNDVVASTTFLNGEFLSSYAQHVGAFVVGGSNLMLTASGMWALRLTSPDVASTRAFFRRFNHWCPFLSSTTAPIDGGDPGSRVAWIRHYLLEGDTAAGATVDSLGFTFTPDDGLAFAPSTWLAPLGGGFGIFKRAGLSSWRWASYSGTLALLESINLPSAAGWHVADIIIRQAIRGDATTPWLTLQWDGVDVITRRAFGDPLLPAPSSIRANAHGWAFMYGPHLTSGDMTFAAEYRCGSKLPNGAPVIG